MKKLLRTAWFITAILGIASTEHLQKHTTTVAPSLCPQLETKCTCSTFDLMFNVNCVEVDDLQSIVDVLNRDFYNETVNHIYLKNSSLEQVPPNAFGNLTVNSVIFNKGFIGNMSEDAFSGLVDLKEVLWQFIPGLDKIPQAVIGYNLSLIRLVNSDVSSVGLEVRDMSSLNVLDLSHNKISSIHPEAFLNCIFLKKVVLNNNKIQKLDRNIFRNVRYLQSLDLDNNQLTTLEGVLKPTAMYIQELQLENNSIPSINSIFQFKAENLRNLVLSGNPLNTLTSKDFNNMFEELQSLRLDRTSLYKIGDATFSGLSRLGYLYLRNNNLTDLPAISLPYSLLKIYLDDNLLTNVSGTFKHLKGLQVLSLNNNRIKDIGKMFDLMPALTKLSLDYNLIETIPNGTFASLPVLNILSLGWNRIQHLTNGSFIGLNQRLFVLDLSSNLIEELGGAFNGRRILPILKKLWLFNNSIESLSDKDLVLPSLIELNLKQNKLSNLTNAILNLANLRTLNVEYNQLQTITRSNFPTRINLKLLLLTGNPLSCDCRLLWLVDSFHKKGHHHIAIDRLSVCAAPKWLKNFYVHKLRPHTVITWKDDCPPECSFCKCYPKLGEISIYVNCQSSNLTSIPTVYPELTLLLNLSDNSLETLPKDLKQYVPNLETLDLRGNFLTTLDGVDIPSGLKALNISRNNFTVFPKDTLSKLDLTNVEVSDNPWRCDCNANQFRLWLQKNIRMVKDINDTQCSKSEANGRLGGKRISSLTEFDFCPVKVALYAIVAIGILAFLLSAAGGFVGYIRYKMPIKVWLYTKGLCLRWVKEEDLDEDKDFDAFVAFSTEEQHCVDEILAELEKKPPHFKLCIHYRDFIGGQLILENIARAVVSSKKTLILLSKSFLESEWTMQEFRQAHHQTMDEKINRIILVLVGELPPDENINEDVRAYLKTATYLRWEDKYLWQKLRYAMPRNPVPRNETNPENSSWSDNDQEPLFRMPDFD